MFCQRGSKFDKKFSWWGDRGSKYRYKWAIIRPPVKRHLNGVWLTCQWWPNNGLVALWFFRGSGPVLLRNPIFLWFFRGGPDPLSPHLWIRPCQWHWRPSVHLIFNIKKSTPRFYVKRCLNCFTNSDGQCFNDTWNFKSTARWSEKTCKLYAMIHQKYLQTGQELFSICILAGLI